MKMRMGRAIKSGIARKQLSGCLQRWQRWLLGLYVALFAWVLPFICWGAAAEPGHPHRLPHFVFATPVLATAVDHVPAEKTAEKPVMAHPNAHHGATHPAVTAAENTPPVADKQPNATVPGRSTPKLLLFSILLLILLGAWLVNRLDLPQFSLAFCHQFPASLVLAVPVRPPRLLGL